MVSYQRHVIAIALSILLYWDEIRRLVYALASALLGGSQGDTMACVCVAWGPSSLTGASNRVRWHLECRDNAKQQGAQSWWQCAQLRKQLKLFRFACSRWNCALIQNILNFVDVRELRLTGWDRLGNLKSKPRRKLVCVDDMWQNPCSRFTIRFSKMSVICLTYVTDCDLFGMKWCRCARDAYRTAATAPPRLCMFYAESHTRM